MTKGFFLVRGAAAVAAASITSIVTFVLVGLVIPIAATLTIFGRDNVEGSPAHGGAILLLTVPMAAFIAAGVFGFLSWWFYERLRRVL